jgi:hypothetical protein
MCRRAISMCRDRPMDASQRGVALVMTLLLTGLLMALGLALTMLSTMETWLSASLRTSQELTLAADAAVARVQVDLSMASDWSALLAAAAAGPPSAFNDADSSPRLPDGTVLDVAAETRALQAVTDDRCGPAASNPDCPRWRLFARGHVSDLVPEPIVSSPTYIAAWIADDQEDADGDPERDANGRLLVRGESFAAGGARRSVEAMLRRTGPGSVQVIAWRELR